MYYFLAFYIGGGFSMSSVWFLRSMREETSGYADPFLRAGAALFTVAFVMLTWPYFIYIAAKERHA